jgi:hypothetical protein
VEAAVVDATQACIEAEAVVTAPARTKVVTAPACTKAAAVVGVATEDRTL